LNLIDTTVLFTGTAGLDFVSTLVIVNKIQNIECFTKLSFISPYFYIGWEGHLGGYTDLTFTEQLNLIDATIEFYGTAGLDFVSIVELINSYPWLYTTNFITRTAACNLTSSVIGQCTKTKEVEGNCVVEKVVYGECIT